MGGFRGVIDRIEGPVASARHHVDEITGRRIPPDRAWTTAHRSHHTWTGQDGTDLLG